MPIVSCEQKPLSFVWTNCDPPSWECIEFQPTITPFSLFLSQDRRLFPLANYIDTKWNTYMRDIKKDDIYLFKYGSYRMEEKTAGEDW